MISVDINVYILSIELARQIVLGRIITETLALQIRYHLLLGSIYGDAEEFKGIICRLLSVQQARQKD